MKQSILRTALLVGAVALLWGVAYAQYRPAPRREAPPETDSFKDEVSLQRFRKGNIGWDTQELIASGLTALHGEHQEILKKLGLLEDRLEGLKQQMERIEAKL